MIAKKNKKVNLERKRFAFFQIGLLISGSLCLAAFEYTTVSADEFAANVEDNSGTILWEDPQDDMKIKIIDPKPKPKPKMINLDQLEDVKVVKHLTETGDVYHTDRNDYINMEGDGEYDLGEIDMTICEEKDIHDFVDVDPSFPGGEAAMAEFLQEKIDYPQLPLDMGIDGVVYLQFVVSTTGSISRVQTLDTPHEDLAKEATRVVKLMPKWVPGEQAGKKVNVRFTLPVHFKLK